MRRRLQASREPAEEGSAQFGPDHLRAPPRANSMAGLELRQLNLGRARCWFSSSLSQLHQINEREAREIAREQRV